MELAMNKIIHTGVVTTLALLYTSIALAGDGHSHNYEEGPYGAAPGQERSNPANVQRGSNHSAYKQMLNQIDSGKTGPSNDFAPAQPAERPAAHSYSPHDSVEAEAHSNRRSVYDGHSNVFKNRR
jgi:hypothetical protein